MRQARHADHFGEGGDHTSHPTSPRAALADGVLKIRSCRLPWAQRLCVLPFIGVGVGGMLVLSMWIAAPRGQGAVAPAKWAPKVTSSWWVLGLCLAWLVIQTAMVRRQRARAVKVAMSRWKVRKNLQGLSEFVSLALSQAGYKDGYFGVAWKRLGEVRDAVRGLASEHRTPPVPRVWVIDDAPTNGLRLLMKCRRAVLKPVVSVGWFQFSPRVIPWIVCCACCLLLPLLAISGLMPWGMSKFTMLGGAGIGLLLGFGVKLLYLRHCWRLVRVRERTFLLRRWIRGGFRWRGPIEARDPLWVLSPIEEERGLTWPIISSTDLNPFAKSYSKHRADLFLHARGLPLVSTQIEEDEVIEYVRVESQPE